MRQLLATVLVLVGATSPHPGDSQAKAARDGTLFFFLSGSDPLSSAAANSLGGLAAALKGGGIRIRPVLLVEDWKAWKRPTEDSPLVRTVRELGGGKNGPGVNIPVYDIEGLTLARAWKLNRLPAFVLVAHGKAHVVYGTRIDLADLSGCER
jgi:hypothetical protein